MGNPFWHIYIVHSRYELLYLKGSGFVWPDPKRVDKAVSCCVRVHAYELIPVNSLKRKVCSKICFLFVHLLLFSAAHLFFHVLIFFLLFFLAFLLTSFYLFICSGAHFRASFFFSLACQVFPHLLICLPPASKSFQGVTHTLYWSGHLVVKPGQMKYQAHHEL